MAEVIKDELLGEIECVDGFEIEVNWVNNKKIDVYFDVEDYYEDDEIDEFVEDMKQVLSEESAEKLRDSEITQETMEKIMSVERLTIYGDGNFSIYLSDNDMIFSGHIINVLANINGEFFEGDIMG